MNASIDKTVIDVSTDKVIDVLTNKTHEAYKDKTDEINKKNKEKTTFILNTANNLLI